MALSVTSIRGHGYAIMPPHDVLAIVHGRSAYKDHVYIKNVKCVPIDRSS